jgi:hypothetical protein
MPKRKGRGRRRTSSALRAPSPERFLDSAPLTRLVPHLAPETLHQLVLRGGLQACGDLVASATPEQLTSLLDLDLWRHGQPGRDEQFDADRFGEWIEVLVDAGEAVAARIVAGLDQHLVIAGLSRYIRVFDPAVVAQPESDDESNRDETGHADVTPECEVGGYLVRATRADSWDAIVALLLALDNAHQECFHAVMCGCRRLSNSLPEVDGLDDLLMEPEQLLHDVAVDREDRRSRQGYSTPADARAFLQMARQRKPLPPDDVPSPKMNPIVAAYFRAVDAAADDDTAARPTAGLTSPGIPESLDAVAGLLAEAGFVPPRAPALLTGTALQPPRFALLQRLIEHVRDANAKAFFARNREMAFLANTLMAGCSVQSRPFTTQEAADAAGAICNLGLEHWPSPMPEAFLVDHDLLMAFEAGWAVLHEDVSNFVAQHLILTLRDLQCDDDEIQDGLDALRRALMKEREAGTPWRARDALDVLAILDTPSWVSLQGLLSECPVLPEALTATLERRTGAVSATTFAFISTSKHIAEIRAFMAKLLDNLSR